MHDDTPTERAGEQVEVPEVPEPPAWLDVDRFIVEPEVRQEIAALTAELEALEWQVIDLCRRCYRAYHGFKVDTSAMGIEDYSGAVEDGLYRLVAEASGFERFSLLPGIFAAHFAAVTDGVATKDPAWLADEERRLDAQVDESDDD